MATVPDFSQMSGLEELRWLRDNPEHSHPPMHAHMGMQIVEVDCGRVVATLSTKPSFTNLIGTVHGGVAATMLDSVMGCAVRSTLAVGVTYTTVELHINYIRAARTDGQLLQATGEIIHSGRRTAVAQGQIRDAEGTLIAHGTTTIMVFQPQP